MPPPKIPADEFVARVARDLRSAQHGSGPLSAPNLIVERHFESVAARLARGLAPNYFQSDLLGLLRLVRAEHPQRFRTEEEVTAQARHEAAQNKPPLPPITEANRKQVLRRMTALELLDLANHEKPKAENG
jgi:hypothetical protein